MPVNYVIAGPEPMLANYDAGYDLERWAARIQAAEEADRVDVAQFRTNANRTGVVGAQLGERGAVVALVIRMSDTRPNDSYLGFSLIRSGAEVCSPSGIASQWQRVTPGLDGEQSSRYLMWLERHGLAREIYASPVHLGMTGCPDPVSIVGATLKLRDGATNADQVVIGSDPMWGG